MSEVGHEHGRGRRWSPDPGHGGAQAEKARGGLRVAVWEPAWRSACARSCLPRPICLVEFSLRDTRDTSSANNALPDRPGPKAPSLRGTSPGTQLNPQRRNSAACHPNQRALHGWTSISLKSAHCNLTEREAQGRVPSRKRRPASQSISDASRKVHGLEIPANKPRDL